MKKLLLGILLGFLLHKGLAFAYSYSFWNAEENCRGVSGKESISCIYKKMGLTHEVLPYLLLTPTYTWKKLDYQY